MNQIQKLLNTIPRFDSALCVTFDNLNMFFPDGPADETKRLPELRAICRSCIHRKECLEYSIREDIPYGIWGGKSPSERGQVLKRTEKRRRAERVIKMRNQGVSTKDIAKAVGMEIHQIHRIYTDANRARKREDQSNQKPNTQLADSSSSLQSAP